MRQHDSACITIRSGPEVLREDAPPLLADSSFFMAESPVKASNVCRGVMCEGAPPSFIDAAHEALRRQARSLLGNKDEGD
jgi:hypothetical protein